jgi:hypothetical protein
MIGKSRTEYVFIRASIFGLRSITPLSIMYVIACAFSRRILFTPWLAAYALIETAFYLGVFLPRNSRLQEVNLSHLPSCKRHLIRTLSLIQAATHPPLTSKADRESLFTRCFELVRDTSVISGWFYHAPVDSLQRDNIVDWIVWAFFGAYADHRDEVVDSWHAEIDDYVTRIEKTIGKTFSPGRNTTVRSMRVTLDPVVCLHRPFVFYTVCMFLQELHSLSNDFTQAVFIVDNWTSLSLWRLGFHYYPSKKRFNVFPPRPFHTLSRRPSLHPHLSYWSKPHRSKTRDPIVFLHGLGVCCFPSVLAWRRRY